MGFSQAVINQAWKRSGGRCECTRLTHGHAGRCPNILVWEAKDMKVQPGSWSAHHRVPEISGGADSAENCEILCTRCLRLTGSFRIMPAAGEETADQPFLKSPKD